MSVSKFPNVINKGIPKPSPLNIKTRRRGNEWRCLSFSHPTRESIEMLKDENGKKEKSNPFLISDELRGNEFENFAGHCPHRVLDQRGEAVCNQHESAPGECAPALCSLFDKLRKAESRGDEYGRNL